MEEERKTWKGEWINFNYNNNEVKYYLLTEGSGYTLAEFLPPHRSVRPGGGLIVPENRPKTAIVPPGLDVKQPG